MFATIGGTTRATNQLSIGIVLRENGFENGMCSRAATARCRRVAREDLIGVFTSWSYDSEERDVHGGVAVDADRGLRGKPGYVRSPTRTPDSTSDRRRAIDDELRAAEIDVLECRQHATLRRLEPDLDIARRSRFPRGACPYSTGRAACTTMRAGPACRSGIARLPIGRMT